MMDRISGNFNVSHAYKPDQAKKVSAEKPLFAADAVDIGTNYANENKILTLKNAVSEKPQATGVHKIEVVKRLESSKWGWIELLRDPDPNFVQRNFHPRGVHRDSEIVKAFGTDKPHSGDVLLHYAGDPPPGVKKQETPVILVHGANKDANFWWDPAEDGSEKGLPQLLKSQGFQVFAVTFPHNQDDNFFWEQELANSINRVKDLTGSDKVDLVGHSKGGVPTRAYCSNYRQDWMTPYQNDVRRLVLVAAPNGGIDFLFRHPSTNFALFEGGNHPVLNAPMSWDKIMEYGFMRDAKDLGMSKEGSDYWPGQRQLLRRLDNEHSLPPYEPDWYTTYNGGRGFVSESRGIDYFIKEGGNFMENLEKSPINPGVEVAVLAGSRPNISGIINEVSGPSDGLLFLSSAVRLPESTNIVAEKIMNLNHKSIVSDRKGQDWIAGVLKADGHKKLSGKELAEIKRKGFDAGRRNQAEVQSSQKVSMQTQPQPDALASLNLSNLSNPSNISIPEMAHSQVNVEECEWNYTI